MKREQWYFLLAVVAVWVGCSSYRRQAGTGDVAFRLAWYGLSDLDLLVEGPTGGCVYFGQRESPSGGLLDVDCNAANESLCERPVENVFWPATTAPVGRYRFWVHTHTLIPAEAPLELQLSVLRGEDPIWSSKRLVRRHEELQGPFEYTYPGELVTGPHAGADLPACVEGRAGGALTPSSPPTSELAPAGLERAARR